MSVQDNLRTHTVHNQVPDLQDESWWRDDLPLQVECSRVGIEQQVEDLVDFDNILRNFKFKFVKY